MRLNGNTNRTRLGVLAFVLLSLAPFPASAGETDEFMDVADVRPGMKGYGLTVFSGTRPTSFGVELLGVLRGALGPRQDMILCKVTHPRLQDIGMVAGMSGSPVYIDGKLLGAIGYGWTYAKEAIGGIAPIKDMMKVYDQVNAAPHQPMAGPGFRDSRPEPFAFQPVRIDAASAPRGLLDGLVAAGQADGQAAARGLTLEPLGTPVMVSAASPYSMELIQKAFAPYGFLIVPSGANGASSQAEGATADGASGARSRESISPDEISGGYSLSIPFITGDSEVGAVGTVTYRRGDKLIAFGHPMFFNGDIDMPMAASRVHTIVRSTERSIKLASALNIIGTLRQDRLVAVGGMIGLKPPMVPVRVRVTSPGGQTKRTFNFRVISHRDLFPAMLQMAVGEAVTALGRRSGEASAEVQYRLQLSDGTVIEKRDFVSGKSVPSLAAAGIGMNCMSLLTNPFKEIAFQDVEASVALSDRVNQARLLSLRPMRPVYKPGETVRLVGAFQPWRGREESFTMDLKLPGALDDGDYDVGLYDSHGRESLERARAPQKSDPRNYQQFIEQASRSFPANCSFLTLEKRSPGLTIRGEELASLPPSISGALEAACKDDSGPMPLAILAESTRPWPYELIGTARATITVDKYGRLK